MHVRFTHVASCFLWQIAAAVANGRWPHTYSHSRLSTLFVGCSQEASSFRLGRLCIVTLAVGKHISKVGTLEWRKLEQAEKDAMPARQALLCTPLLGRQHDTWRHKLCMRTIRKDMSRLLSEQSILLREADLLCGESSVQDQAGLVPF